MGEPARLLDVTRLVNRAGLHPTGVDRVERAYLDALTSRTDGLIFAIARTAIGYVILDSTGARALNDAVKDGNWGHVDLLSKLNPRLDAPRRRGQSFVRKHAAARARRGKLADVLRGVLPAEFTYLNVGHSNLNTRMFDAMRAARKVVLIHDTIPLDWPDTQREGAVDAFAKKLSLVSARADQVICTSAQCASDVVRHMDGMGRVPPIVTAHLGVDVAVPDPDFSTPEPPYFVTVGTIEPRKNHALLLDIWADWPDAPPLVICGKRGWNNAAVFARLDAKPAQVIEQNDLTDQQIAALIAGARGMLFPSVAEGFGLPPAEARALGTRVLCASLPVYGEILDNTAVYVAPNDRYLWEKAIKSLAEQGRTDPIPDYMPPTWDAHFNMVLSLI